MRGFLNVVMIGGILAFVGGGLFFIILLPEAAKTPVVVIFPQLMEASLFAGFGLVTIAVSATGLALTEGQERQNEIGQKTSAQLQALIGLTRVTQEAIKERGASVPPTPASSVAPQPGGEPGSNGPREPRRRPED